MSTSFIAISYVSGTYERKAILNVSQISQITQDDEGVVISMVSGTTGCVEYRPDQTLYQLFEAIYRAGPCIAIAMDGTLANLLESMEKAAITT